MQNLNRSLTALAMMSIAAAVMVQSRHYVSAQDATDAFSVPASEPTDRDRVNASESVSDAPDHGGVFATEPTVPPTRSRRVRGGAGTSAASPFADGSDDGETTDSASNSLFGEEDSASDAGTATDGGDVFGPSGGFVSIPKPANELKVFALKNADSQESADLLTKLFAKRSVTAVADVRTNSVIVQGDAQTLKEIEAILLRLDDSKSVKKAAPPTTKPPVRTYGSIGGPGVSTYPIPFRSTPKYSSSEEILFGSEQSEASEFANLLVEEHDSGAKFFALVGKDSRIPFSKIGDYVTWARKGFTFNEERAARSAAKLKQLRSTGKLDEAKKVHTELSSAVRRAFAWRQRLQRAELVALRLDLQAVEKRIKRREELSDSIIERRLQHLEGDDELDWTPRGTSPRRGTSANGSGDPFSAATPLGLPGPPHIPLGGPAAAGTTTGRVAR